MKPFVFFTVSLSLLFSHFAGLPDGQAMADLTEKDLRQIESIVRQEVRQEVAASEARMKELLDLKISTLDTKISSLDTKFSIKIDELDKRLNIIFALLIALMALVAGGIVIPQVIIASKEKGAAALQEQIHQLRQEMETLKSSSRVIKP
jgi:chaperonin cofactor prefoldin